jgi:hypothetical protein
MERRAREQQEEQGEESSSGRGFLGIMPDDQFDGQGARVSDVVPNSPAAKQGLKSGDVIQRVDGTKIASLDALVKALGEHKPGDVVTLRVLRDDETVRLRVTLGSAGGTEESQPQPAKEKKEKAPAPETKKAPKGGGGAFLGVQLGDDEGEGATINSLTPGSPADNAGLQAGDVVTKVGKQNIGGAQDLVAAIGALNPGTNVKLTVKREGKTKTINVTLGQRSDTKPEAMATDESEGDSPEVAMFGGGDDAKIDDLVVAEGESNGDEETVVVVEDENNEDSEAVAVAEDEDGNDDSDVFVMDEDMPGFEVEVAEVDDDNCDTDQDGECDEDCSGDCGESCPEENCRHSSEHESQVVVASNDGKTYTIHGGHVTVTPRVRMTAPEIRMTAPQVRFAQPGRARVALAAPMPPCCSQNCQPRCCQCPQGQGETQLFTAMPGARTGRMPPQPSTGDEGMNAEMRRLTERLQQLERTLRALQQQLAKQHGDMNLFVDAEEPGFEVEVAEAPPKLEPTEEAVIAEIEENAEAPEEANCCSEGHDEADCCSQGHDEEQAEEPEEADEPEGDVGQSTGLSIFM